MVDQVAVFRHTSIPEGDRFLKIISLEVNLVF